MERERRADEGYDDEDEYYDEDEQFKEETQDGNKSKNDGRGKSQKQGDNMADLRKKKGSKFDDSDDDQYDKGGARDPYSKPSRGGGKQVNQEKKGKQ